MANRFATKDGVWSDPTVWDGGTLPGPTDNVWCNGFDVTIDQNITVAALHNDNSNGMSAASGKEFLIGASCTINANFDHSNVVNGITVYSILKGIGLSGITLVINGDCIESDPTSANINAKAIEFTSVTDAHITFNGNIYLKRNYVSCTAIRISSLSGTTATFIHNGDILVRDPNSTDNVSPAVELTGQEIDYTFTGTMQDIDVSIGSSGNTFNCSNQFGTNTFNFGVSNITGYIGTGASRIYSAAEGQTVVLTANEIIGKGGDYAVELGTPSTCDAMTMTVNADIKSLGGKALYCTGEVNCIATLNGDIYRSSLVTTSNNIRTANFYNTETVINGDIKAGGYGVGVYFSQSNVNRVINGTVFGECDGGTGAIAVYDSGNHGDTDRLIVDTVDLTNANTADLVIDCNILNLTTNTNVPLIKNVIGAVGVDYWIDVPYLMDANGSYTLPNGAGGVTTFTSGSGGIQPATTDVRDGVEYGNALTGSLKVPNPAYVTLGVPTDNTVGTLDAAAGPNVVINTVNAVQDGAWDDEATWAEETIPDATTFVYTRGKQVTLDGTGECAGIADTELQGGLVLDAGGNVQLVDAFGDPLLSDVALLAELDNSYTDETGNVNNLTGGSFSTVQSQFGNTHSITVDKFGITATMPAVAAYEALTVEWWWYPTSLSGSQYFGQYGGNKEFAAASVAALNLNEWNHIAYVQLVNGTRKEYVNGVNTASGGSMAKPSAGTWKFFAPQDSFYTFLAGYLRGLRVTISNAARYTSNFVPPANVYPTFAPTPGSTVSGRVLLGTDGALVQHGVSPASSKYGVLNTVYSTIKSGALNSEPVIVGI